MKAALSLILALALAGCSTSAPARVTSRHSSDFTSERAAKAGTVWVMENANSKMNEQSGGVPKQVAEDALRAKGFRVVPGPAGAEYAFRFVTMQTDQPAPGSMFAKTDLYSEQVFVRRVVGQLWSLRADGGADQELWRGEARVPGFRFDAQKIDGDLMKKLLERFPK